jgi:hypothetical protein
MSDAIKDDLVKALELSTRALDMIIRNRPENYDAPTNIALDVIVKGNRAVLLAAEDIGRAG